MKYKHSNSVSDADLPAMYDIVDRLPYCGCGDPEGALRWLRDVLQEIRDDLERAKQRPIGTYDEASWQRHLARMVALGLDTEKDDAAPDAGLPWFVYYTLDKLKLTEHGTSVRAGWLTEDGKKLLAAMTGVADLDAWHTEIHDRKWNPHFFKESSDEA